VKTVKAWNNSAGHKEVNPDPRPDYLAGHQVLGHFLAPVVLMTLAFVLFFAAGGDDA